MSQYCANEFFDMDGWEHQDLFAPDQPVWSALGQGLVRYLDQWGRWGIHGEVHPGAQLLGERIFVAPGCHIEPGAVLIGPAIIGPGVEIRTGAYIRQYVILGENAIAGAHSELKMSILLPGARAPHQAYVGDSILGREVNLGAGTICSNVKNVGREVSFRHGAETVHTGLRKFGAILGDGCKTGCNTVLNPGVLMGPGCVTYPNATLRSGYYPPGTLVKVRQQQDLVEMTRIRERG